MDVRKDIRTKHLPSKRLFLEFLSLYRKKRQPDRESYSNMIKGASERVVSLGGEATSTKLDGMVKEIENKIARAENWDDWYNLILILRHKAKEAQKLKIPAKQEEETQSYLSSTLTMLARVLVSDEDSILFETFHAMANLIIRELNDCPFEDIEDTKKYFLPLNKQIMELEADRQIAIQLGTKALMAGKSNESFLKTENDLLLSLAYLGDVLRIDDARKHNLLTGLKNPSLGEIAKIKSLSTNFQLHEGVPLCLQAVYVEYVFEKRYRELEGCRVPFDQFKTDALKKETLDIQSKLEEQRLLKEEENKRKQEEELEKQKQKELAQEMADLRQQRLSNSTASGAGGKESADPSATQNPQPVPSQPQPEGMPAPAPSQPQPEGTGEKKPSDALNKSPSSASLKQLGHFAPQELANSTENVLNRSLGIKVNPGHYPKI